MTRDQVVVLLYVLAGVLEVAGVATVAVDLIETRRRGRFYGKRSRTLIIEADDPNPTPPSRSVEARLRREIDALEEQVAVTDWQLFKLIGAEDFKLRAWFGFGALLLGVLIGTAGNLVSAT